MNLRFTLPEREGALFSALCRGEKLIYCVPFDLHDDGSYCADGWIAVTSASTTGACGWTGCW